MGQLMTCTSPYCIASDPWSFWRLLHRRHVAAAGSKRYEVWPPCSCTTYLCLVPVMLRYSDMIH
ncbi:unnamed protein product [Prunus armeniaca]|uniref:Uncharacterized protein n=1 Tax=Prunus armeniaca TaxID=36596 RepID=A0A6J5TRB6_PRUAR|nr:unnamed protein product [Prunus armeniaca]CAB4295592.1 unnamed protein product [Prunus armeniaca]